MKHLLIVLLIACMGVAVSCSDEAAEAYRDTGSLVVEGSIESDGYIKVLLTSSIVPDAEGGTLDDCVIRWGKVTVSNGSSTVILTGGPDRRYLPPYIYYSYKMMGEPGKTYTLTAEYGGKTVTSVCTMPVPTPISRVESALTDTPGLCSLTIFFDSPDDCPAYYRVCTQLLGEDAHPYQGVLGIVEVTTPGIEVSVPAYRGKHFGNSEDFTPLWPEGAQVKVVLERVTREVYEFWSAYNNEMMFGGSQFVGSPGNLPGNVSGGLGVWSAAGVSSRVVVASVASGQ